MIKQKHNAKHDQVLEHTSELKITIKHLIRNK